MSGKIAIVAGGTAGVGLSIVKELVKNKYNVFFIGSNQEKGEKIETELRKGSESNVHFVKLDLSNLREVSQFAENFKQKNERLDLLLHTAGVILPKRIETPEGFEKTFAIGYLSAFILSNSLGQLLEKTKDSRIINVCGDPILILKSKLNFDNLNFADNYSGFKTAITTIHAKTVLTQLLSEKFSHKNIDVNSFHPGVVKSDLIRNMPIPLKALMKIVNLFLSNESKTGIYVSISDVIKGTTGKLFVNKKAIALKFDSQYKEKLWLETEKILKTI